MTITLTPDAFAFVAFGTCKYLVIDREGRIRDRNAYGKATDYAFQQRGAAETAVNRANRALDGTMTDTFVVFDVRAGKVL